MSSGPNPAATEALNDANEFDRWQSIEREAWGGSEIEEDGDQSKAEQRARKKEKSRANRGEDRSGLPLLVLFLFGIAFFGGLWWFFVISGGADDEAADEAAMPNAVVEGTPREVAAPPPVCGPVRDLLANDRDPGDGSGILGYLLASQLDVAKIGEIGSADAELARLAVPMELRAQIILGAVPSVQAGDMTLEEVRAQVAPLDAQISEVVSSFETFVAQSC